MGDKVAERAVRQIHGEGVTVSGDLTVYSTKSAEARIKELEAELAEAKVLVLERCAYEDTIERLRQERDSYRQIVEDNRRAVLAALEEK